MADKDGVPSERDDWFQFFVHTANQTRAGGGLTLAIPGGIITGWLIGISEYFELAGKEAIEGVDDAELKRQIEREITALGQPDKGARDVEITAVRHYHLKDARFITAAGLIPNVGPGLLWRGRIQEVSGFATRSLGPPTK